MGLSVSCVMLLPVHGPAFVYHSLRSGIGVGASHGRASTPLAGRLAGRCGVAGSSASASGTASLVVQVSGDRHKLGEIGPPAICSSPVSGDVDWHVSQENFPITSSSCSVSGVGDVFPSASVTPSMDMAAAAGPYSIAGTLSSQGSHPHASPPVATHGRRPDRSDPSVAEVHHGSVVVASCLSCRGRVLFWWATMPWLSLISIIRVARCLGLCVSWPPRSPCGPSGIQFTHWQGTCRGRMIFWPTSSAVPTRFFPQSFFQGCRGDLQRLRPSPSQPVCHLREHEASTVCVPGSGPANVEAGCLSTPMGPSVSLYLPAICSSLAGSLLSLALTGLSSVLVAPLWPQKEWFIDLLSLLVDEPLKLLLVWKLLVQPHMRKFHWGLKTLSLHTWRLSSVSSERQAFRGKFCESQPRTSGTPLQPFTNLSGPGSLVGVIDGVSIHARRLSLR